MEGNRPRRRQEARDGAPDLHDSSAKLAAAVSQLCLILLLYNTAAARVLQRLCCLLAWVWVFIFFFWPPRVIFGFPAKPTIAELGCLGGDDLTCFFYFVPWTAGEPSWCESGCASVD